MTDHAAINRLIALYSHLLDDRRYDDWIRLFTDDGIMVVGTNEYRGRSAIETFVRSIERDPPGKHFCGLPVIDADNDAARAWTDLMIIVPAGPGLVATTAMARYHDVLKRVDGRWLFARRTICAQGKPLPGLAPPVPAA